MAKASLRTPLGQVRGAGAARSGTGDFIAQRVSGVALALLAPYLAISAALGMNGHYESARAWAGGPLVAPALGLFLIAALYHMRIGMQVIIEDYIAKPSSRTLLSMLNLFVVFAAGAAGLAALIKLYTGA
jgi:succinate dehydrogenase / fumarate reductase membrane anchor subunit